MMPEEREEKQKNYSEGNQPLAIYEGVNRTEMLYRCGVRAAERFREVSLPEQGTVNMIAADEALMVHNQVDSAEGMKTEEQKKSLSEFPRGWQGHKEEQAEYFSGGYGTNAYSGKEHRKISCEEISRTEMLCRCGVREALHFHGVRVAGQETANMIVADDVLIAHNCQVCSVEERMKIEEQEKSLADFYRVRQEREEEQEEYFSDNYGTGGYLRQGYRKSFLEMGVSSLKKGKQGYAAKESGEGTAVEENGGGEEYAGNKGKRIDKTKRAMLRNYAIKEIIHEEGKTDSQSHFKLLKQLTMHELTKPVKMLGKLILGWLLKLFGMLIMFLVQVVALLFPLFILIYFMLHPLAFFQGIYDDEEIMNNPLSIRNVVQEMYAGFYGDISTFSDTDANNQVEYVYGKCSRTQADEILAVYLACSCLDDEYGKLDVDEGYPPYMLADTEKEKALLSAVFRQFNYTETEGITVRGMTDSGNEWEAQAEKMTVHCLTIEKWKSLHMAELTEEKAELLAELLEQIQSMTENGAGAFGEEGAVPIEDLVIPENLDENLVYLAGFIKAEAGNQSYQGKIAVAYVILNRAGGPSGNIKGVLTVPYQFSCYIPYHTVEKYLQEYTLMTEAQRSQDACWRVATEAYYGTAANPIGTMKYYCNPKYCSAGETEQWEKIYKRNDEDEILIIGDHVFCQNCW